MNAVRYTPAGLARAFYRGMSVRDEIDEARRRLSLSAADVTEVPEPEARRLLEMFLGHFTGGRDFRWWWEHFTFPTTSVRFADQRGFERISAVVPDTQERVWFVAEDGQLPHFPVYDATPAAVQKLIGECYGFEYYLIAKDLRWLLCENHHDLMIAVGTIRERLTEHGA